MLFQSHESGLLQSGEEHQLGTFISSHQRNATLSGKVIFTGLLLLIIGIIGLIIEVFIPYGMTSPSGFFVSVLPEWGQLVFACGICLSTVRREGLVTPLHARFSLAVYNDGLIYRKGRTIGWYHATTYQPEGKLVVWEEAYGIVLEIATFAFPNEVKTDTADLLRASRGYSVSTRNLCLFFYDSSVSQRHIEVYLRVMANVCR